MTSDPQETSNLEQSYKTLHNLMESILDSSLDGIILVDEEGKIRLVNQVFKRLYGFENCDLVGMDILNFQSSACCCFRQPEESQKFFKEIFALGDPVIRRELDLTQPVRKVISFYARPVVDREGKILGRISIHTDVTVERNLQAEMREAQTQLIQSEKMASLGMLVAGIAHEINTPIGSINSNNDILVRAVGKMRDFLNCAHCPSEVANDPEVVKIMGILEEINRNNRLACDRIITIIRNLKNFARLDEAERKQVNIHEGLDSTLTLVQHQLKPRIQVIKEYGELPEIECFPNQLNQVFMNLFVNAGQAMPDQGTLSIKTFRQGQYAKIVISDTGIGIPSENLSKIFDPGFTTKGVGVGTGLGLSICLKIIQDHHGRIDVESEVGKGTTFTVTLPIQNKGA